MSLPKSLCIDSIFKLLYSSNSQLLVLQGIITAVNIYLSSTNIFTRHFRQITKQISLLQRPYTLFLGIHAVMCLSLPLAKLKKCWEDLSPYLYLIFLTYSFFNFIIIMLTAQSQSALPPRFADKVLELESLFDDYCSIEIITKLNELYRIAIDHYIHNDVKKANFFQKKMIRLFNDPLTLKLIQNNESPPQKLKQISQKSKIEEQISRFSICSEQYVKVILQQSEKALKKSEALKVNNLNKQQQSLKNRILLKKSKSQQKLEMMRLNGAAGHASK